MLKIDTQGKSLNYNLEVIPSRNVCQVEKIGQSLKIYLRWSSRSYIEVIYSDIYVDNVVLADVDAALQFFQSDFFAEASQGGGVPTLGDKQFIIGGASGNVTRRIAGTDLGPVSGSSPLVVYYWRVANNDWRSLSLASVPTSDNQIPHSGPGGQLRFGKGTSPDSGVRKADIDGIINDTLTTSETSTTLNALYSSFGNSDKVTSIDNKVTYTKISTGWKKEIFEIV